MLQGKLLTTLEGRSAEGKVKVTKDKADADNPMDREEEDEDRPAVDLKGFTKVGSISFKPHKCLKYLTCRSPYFFHEKKQTNFCIV